METLWKTLTYPFRMLWNSIFENDAHKIVSKQGQKELLIQLMHEDAKNGLYADYSDDMRAYVHQYNNMEKKQSSIEWFFIELMTISKRKDIFECQSEFKKAKEMYDKEIEKAYLEGLQDCQRYLKQTFGGQDNE